MPAVAVAGAHGDPRIHVRDRHAYSLDVRLALDHDVARHEVGDELFPARHAIERVPAVHEQPRRRNVLDAHRPCCGRRLVAPALAETHREERPHEVRGLDSEAFDEVAEVRGERVGRHAGDRVDRRRRCVIVGRPGIHQGVVDLGEMPVRERGQFRGGDVRVVLHIRELPRPRHQAGERDGARQWSPQASGSSRTSR